MLTLLDRYIFRSVLLSSLGAVGVFAFVLLVGNSVKLLQLLAAEQISVGTFARLTLILVPYVVSFALPMGFLSGVLLVLGRLSAQQEITAMRAAGWGIPRIAVPILVLAVLGAGVSAVFNTKLGPRAMSSHRAELTDAIRTNPLSFIVPREFVTEFPDLVVYVGEKAGSRISDVWIWVLDGQKRAVQVIRGDTGECHFDEEAESLNIRLTAARIEARPEKGPEDFPREGKIGTLSGGSLSFKLPLKQLLGERTYRRKLSLLTYDELAAELREAAAATAAGGRGASARDPVTIRYAMQKQFALAGAVLAFALVGVPLGIKMQRKESSANLGLALVLAFGYYFLLILIDWAQKSPGLRPDLLLWLPNLLFAGLGLWLFRRVDRQDA